LDPIFNAKKESLSDKIIVWFRNFLDNSE
jgi:hypothetical protein